MKTFEVATLCMVIIGTAISSLTKDMLSQSHGVVPSVVEDTLHLTNKILTHILPPERTKASQDGSCGRCLFKLTCGHSTYAQFVNH